MEISFLQYHTRRIENTPKNRTAASSFCRSLSGAPLHLRQATNLRPWPMSGSVAEFDTNEWMESLIDSTTESSTWQPTSDFSLYAADPFSGYIRPQIGNPVPVTAEVEERRR